MVNAKELKELMIDANELRLFYTKLETQARWRASQGDAWIDIDVSWKLSEAGLNEIKARCEEQGFSVDLNCGAEERPTRVIRVRWDGNNT